MTTSDASKPHGRQAPTPTADDVFSGSEPIRQAEDLGRERVFDDGEVEQFLADLYAMRRSDVA